MTNSIQPQNLAQYLGTDVLSSIVGDAAKKYLKKLLDKQHSINFPDFSKQIEHSSYEEFRNKLATSGTLAAVSNDERLDALLKQWVSLQQGYAKQVIKTIKADVGEQRELLAEADRELTAGQAEREAYESLGRIPVAQMDDAALEKWKTLKGRIAQLDNTAKERERWHRAVAGVSRVEQTLTTLIDKDLECIHYAIPSVKEIQDRLGDNKYDGPDFQPFLVSNRVTVNDIFMRNITTPSIRMGDTKRDLNQSGLHPVLSELIIIYEHVRDQSPGTVIMPSEIVRSLKLEKIGAKGMASYLEDNENIFGVQARERKGGSRTFIRKESDARLNNNYFLAYMADGKLQHTDAKEVNEYYLQKTLTLMRELPEAYLGFTQEDVKKIAANNKFPIGRLYIPRNMTTRATDLGLKLIPQDDKSEKYVFSKMIPTDIQITYIKEAIDAFGISRFTPAEVAGKIRELHKSYSLLPKVAEVVLNGQHEDLGYRIASNDPLQYQRKDRSVSGPAEPRRKTGTGDRLM